MGSKSLPRREDKKKMKRSSKQNKYPQTASAQKTGTHYFKKFTPKTGGQRAYFESIDESRIVICKGPAGTGKTFLASYYAMQELQANNINKIVVCRPIVESGERLGFLPGDIDDKVHPYLLPILDSFEKMVGPAQTEKYMQDNIIEIAPLAYMRGRTFGDGCIVVADEMQNASKEQLKMLLTRIGPNSKFIISGDISQSDTHTSKENNALNWAWNKLQGKNSQISCIELGRKDIVRDPIVEEIITYLDSPD